MILPVEKLPEWAQILSYASPLYYANEIIQHIIADGDLGDVLSVFGQLVTLGLVVMTQAILTFQERD